MTDLSLRNYAHLGDAVWEIFVREYVIYKTSNPKILHKLTTERVNASFQAELLYSIEEELSDEEKELARRGRNLSIPVGRKAIQNIYRPATAFEVLIGYWYLNDKERLQFFYKKFEQIEAFN